MYPLTLNCLLNVWKVVQDCLVGSIRLVSLLKEARITYNTIGITAMENTHTFDKGRTVSAK